MDIPATTSGDRASVSISPGLNQSARTGMWNLALFVALALQVVISFYFFWMLPTGDEALHMYNASRVAQGQWPYLDFFAYITPGTYLLGGAVFAASAQKVILLRILMAAFALAGIVLMHRIINILVSGDRARTVWLAVYVSVTALSATYFSHHNIDQFLLVVLLYLVVRHGDHRRLYAMLGSVVALDSFVHQAHGAYYFLAVGLYILLLTGDGGKEKIRKLWQFSLPSVILYAFFGIFLVLNGALQNFVHDTVIWITTVYGRFLAFGYFEDTIFHVQRGENLPEQAFFFTSKVAILAGAAFMLWQIATRRGTEQSASGGKLPAIILLAAILGHIQTMQNPVSYYVLFYTALGVYVLRRAMNWPLYIVLACTLIQVVRVTSFPVRYADEMLDIPGNLVGINGNYFYRSEEAVDVAALGRRLKEHDIRQAVVVNRSPELYFLLGISNPTRHDVILPVYLTDAQLGQVLDKMKSGYVIYDHTLERLRDTGDFFDTHHYKKDPDRLERIERSDLFRLIQGKRRLFETRQYVVYG